MKKMKKMEISNTQKLNVFVELLELTDYKVFPAKKHMETFEEFINSVELYKVHEGFQSKTSMTKELFRQAWVSEDGKLFVEYSTNTGRRYVSLEQIGSCISNGGLYRVIPLEFGLIIDKLFCYDKSSRNNELFKKRSTVTIDAYSV